MNIKLYTVTYSSYSKFLCELYSYTKVFTNYDDALNYQRNNILGICCSQDLSNDFYMKHKDDQLFEYSGRSISDRTIIEQH